MTDFAAGDRTVVTILSEITITRSQQKTIEIALPITFRRSWRRRFESMALPLLVAVILFSTPYFGVLRHERAEFATRFIPGLLLVCAVGTILGFIFLHRLINWLANICMDFTEGTSILIDDHGLTDRRVAEHRIDWEHVSAVKIVKMRGIDEVELTFKAGTRCRFRGFRLDYTIFNGIARRGKGDIVGIDVKYFDTDAYIIASLIQEMVKRHREAAFTQRR